MLHHGTKLVVGLKDSLCILYVRFACVLVAVDTGAIELLRLRRRSVPQVGLAGDTPPTVDE